MQVHVIELITLISLLIIYIKSMLNNNFYFLLTLILY